MQRFESRVHFRCPACRAHNVQSVEVPELNSVSEMPTELTSEGNALLWCEACECEFSAEVWCDASLCRFTLHEYPHVVLTGDPPFYAEDESDYWIDYDPPDDPLAVCLTTLNQIVSLLTPKPTHIDDPQLLNRMIFAQAITALETYLFDTLVRRVSADRTALLKLLERDKNINQDKFTLRTIASNERFVEDQVRKYLETVLYHNLERVNFLYSAVFGFSIKADEPNWELLLQATAYRHDCVHRNGVNAEGKKLLMFSPEYVGHVIKVVRALVSRIGSKIAADDDSDLPD